MDILVTVDHLAKSFGAHDIFDKVSFTIRQGEKLGLVGVNGSGKTTLLRCLMDPSFADKGTVQYAGEIRVGYVEQYRRRNHLGVHAPFLPGYSFPPGNDEGT